MKWLCIAAALLAISPAAKAQYYGDEPYSGGYGYPGAGRDYWPGGAFFYRPYSPWGPFVPRPYSWGWRGQGRGYYGPGYGYRPLGNCAWVDAVGRLVCL